MNELIELQVFLFGDNSNLHFIIYYRIYME